MSTKEFTQQIFALTDNMGDMQPLPTSLFSVFQLAELASATALAASLSSPPATGAADLKVAALDVAMCMSGGTHAGFQSLLDGFRSATDTRARDEFLRHASRWIRGNASQIEQALSYMRRFSAPQEMPVVTAPLPELSVSGAAYAGAGLGLPSASQSARRTAVRAEAGGIALATGAMSQELRRVLHLSQSLEFKQTQALIQRLSEGDFYSSLYLGAKKLVVDIPELGLNFETALVSRFDLPEMIHLGSSGLMAYGFTFVMEDFFADVAGQEKDMFIKLCAVHEYGEAVLGNHHEASLLELAVARHWGVLEKYLEFLEGRYSAKFRDVAMHRLKGRLVEGLRDAGFEIETPPDDETGWSPPAKDDPEVIKLLGIIGQNPVQEAITARFTDAIRDDMKMSDDELSEWVLYVTVLEQTRACHARASSDAEEILSPSSSALDLRVALFRALGVLQSEMEDEVVDSNLLGDDLRDHLFSKFIETLRGIIEDRAPQLASDHLLAAARSHFERLAAKDAAIWRALGLNLHLADAEDDDKRLEQRKIEETRLAAWKHAVEAGPETNRQSAVLGEYRDALKAFEIDIRQPLDDILRSIETDYARRGTPAGYLDRGDYQTAITARLWDRVHKISPLAQTKFVDEMIDARAAEVLPKLGFQFNRVSVQYAIPGLAVESIARVGYLSKRYPAQRRAGKTRIEEIFASILVTADIALQAGKLGLIPRPLAVDIVRRMLSSSPSTYCESLLPTVDKLPYQIATEEGDLSRVLGKYRENFAARLGDMDRGSGIFKEALETAGIFWDALNGGFVARAATIFKLAEEYPGVLPQLGRALRGLKPCDLWGRLGLKSAFDRKSQKFEDKANLYSPAPEAIKDEFSLDRYLTPFAVAGEDAVKISPDAIERTAGFGRWHVLEELSKNVLLVVRSEYTQTRLNLHAEWMRRGLVAHLANASGRSPAEISAELPDFRVDAEELWELQDGMAGRLLERGFKYRSKLVEFLRDLVRYSIAPAEAIAMKVARDWEGAIPPASALPYPEARRAVAEIDEFIRTLDVKEGLDRFGTIGTRRKKLFLQILDGEARPEEVKKAGGQILGHYSAILRHAEEFNARDIALLADEIYEVAGSENVDPFETFGPLYASAMTATQIYLLRETESGSKFMRDSDVFDFLKTRLNWVGRVPKREFEKDFFKDYSLVSPSPLAQIRAAQTLEGLEGGTYDELGLITYEERQATTTRIMERQRNRPALDINALGTLGAHWMDVIMTLADHPDLEHARRILLDVTRDALAVYARLRNDSFTRTLIGLNDVIWMTRQTWTLMEIRSGRRFANGSEVLAVIPQSMLIEGEPRIQDPVRGFHRNLIRTVIGGCKERRVLAVRLRAHFRANHQR